MQNGKLKIEKEENPMEDKKCLQTLCARRRGVLGVGRKVLGYGRRGALGRKVVDYGRLGAVLIIAIATLAWASGAGADTCKAIHVFTGTAGNFPRGNLTFDAAGNLYGTTEHGGGSGCGGRGCGVVWKLKANPNGTWTISIIHQFKGPDGANPFVAGLLFDAVGNLYGTTSGGGSTACRFGCGVVFKLAPNSDGTWTESALYSFTGGADGAAPGGSLIFDAAGNLYGTTQGGGAYGEDTVFKLAPNPDGTWTERVLYSFTGGADGLIPLAGLVFDAAGNLYGTTGYGGADGSGVVFKLAPNPDGTWTESVLYSFTGYADGSIPGAGLIFDPTGNLYGTTTSGGPFSAGECPAGCGVVFKLAPNPDGTWTESVLHSFTGGANGYSPAARLAFDATGSLYGTTPYGGADNYGVVFKLTPTSGGWSETVLHTFLGVGKYPFAPAVFDPAGNLYGTTFEGSNNYGLVFRLTP
jgi:uncharacterized repeat protein (TIGR03803 family)